MMKVIENKKKIQAIITKKLLELEIYFQKNRQRIYIKKYLKIYGNYIF